MNKPRFSGEIAAIGSLPFEDSEKAVKFILKYLHNFPHWPQLPNLGEKEDFIQQYVSNLIERDFIYKNEKGYLRARTNYDDSSFTNKLTDFMEISMAVEEGDETALKEFAFPSESAEGFYKFLEVLSESDKLDFEFIKGQVSGPLTLGLEIKDSENKSVFFDNQWQEIIALNLANKAKWQTRELNKFGKETVIFFDDPALTAYGRSSYVSLQREDIVKCFEKIVKAVQAEKALAGIHVCAGADLSIALDAGIDILNFDTYDYFNSVLPYTERLKDFLSSGGYLAWGIVPSDERIFEESTISIFENLKEKIKKLEDMGISAELIKKQSFITPACGLGSRSEDVAVRVYKVLNEIYENGCDKF